MIQSVEEALRENGFPEKSIPAALALIDAIHDFNMHTTSGHSMDVEDILDDLRDHPHYYASHGRMPGVWKEEEFLELFGGMLDQIDGLARMLLS